MSPVPGLEQKQKPLARGDVAGSSNEPRCLESCRAEAAGLPTPLLRSLDKAVDGRRLPNCRPLIWGRPFVTVRSRHLPAAGTKRFQSRSRPLGASNWVGAVATWPTINRAWVVAVPCCFPLLRFFGPAPAPQPRISLVSHPTPPILLLRCRQIVFLFACSASHRSTKHDAWAAFVAIPDSRSASWSNLACRRDYPRTYFRTGLGRMPCRAAPMFRCEGGSTGFRGTYNIWQSCVRQSAPLPMWVLAASSVGCVRHPSPRPADHLCRCLGACAAVLARRASPRGGLLSGQLYAIR